MTLARDDFYARCRATGIGRCFTVYGFRVTRLTATKYETTGCKGNVGQVYAALLELLREARFQQVMEKTGREHAEIFRRLAEH